MDGNNYNANCDWQGGDFGNQKHPIPVDREDLSYMLDDATPLKDCGDLAGYVKRGDTSKRPKEYKADSSTSKRRRMLQFETQAPDSTVSIGGICSAASTGVNPSVFAEDMLKDTSPSSFPALDLPSEQWFSDCLNDINFPVSSDVCFDISEILDDVPESEANLVHKSVIQAANPASGFVFKGSGSSRVSNMQTPKKSASTIVYPFSFIKPSALHGELTLKDINERICPQPLPKAKQSTEETSASFPISNFSGKPVVGKAKIRTEGNGSITVMRTKG